MPHWWYNCINPHLAVSRISNPIRPYQTTKKNLAVKVATHTTVQLCSPQHYVHFARKHLFCVCACMRNSKRAHTYMHYMRPAEHQVALTLTSRDLKINGLTRPPTIMLDSKTDFYSNKEKNLVGVFHIADHCSQTLLVLCHLNLSDKTRV